MCALNREGLAAETTRVLRKNKYKHAKNKTKFSNTILLDCRGCCQVSVIGFPYLDCLVIF